MERELDAIEARVVGALLEKEVTVPGSYPMTMNGLLTACNQTSGRDPVTHLTEAEVGPAIDRLKALGLVRMVHASHGARTVKYRQVAHEALALDAGPRSALTLLLLRGPQTPGELRTRADRLGGLATLEDVAAALRELAARDQPLVAQLDRQPGQKEARWRQLLAPDTGASTPAASSASEASGPSAPAPEPIGPVPEALAPLAPFVGRWVGAGAGEYPTIEGFAYTQQLEVRPVPGKPFLAWTSRTRAADDQRPLHAEVGWLRLAGTDGVELLVAGGNGIVEVVEGLVDGGELVLESTTVAGTSSAKEVTRTERRYRVEGDVLTYDLAMAAVGQPMAHHLTGRLTRQA